MRVFRELWGEQKREDLLASLKSADFDGQYEPVQPEKGNRFRLRPHNVAVDYAAWPEIEKLAAFGSLGILENRGETLISLDRELLEMRMRRYFDPEVSFEQLQQEGFGLTRTFARFDARKTRMRVMEAEGFDEAKIVPHFARPFDLRWCYYTSVRPIWNERRPELASQYWEGNSFFITRKGRKASLEGAPMVFTTALGAQHSISTDAYYFPLQLRRELAPELVNHETTGLALEARFETIANLSVAARAYLADLGLESPDGSAEIASLLWHHALAIGYSRAYREEHAGGLAADWPRVPLPLDAETLRASAALGARVAALLDMAREVEGIESGAFRKELEAFGSLRRTDGNPIEDGDAELNLNENWGFFGERGIVQPGTPRLTPRAASAAEIAGLEALGLPLDTFMLDLPLCRDKEQKSVLSEWSGVPKPVWETVIGGYPVLKKWLSYRDVRVLGRALHLEEAQEVENIVRRLVVLWSLGAELDANYEQCAANCRPLLKEAVEE